MCGGSVFSQLFGGSWPQLLKVCHHAWGLRVSVMGP